MTTPIRSIHVDFLRALGLLLIILAHTDPPTLVFQLRNFDVPLMVLVSGISFGLSRGHLAAYPSYLYKRIERLVFPVWIFLSFYFVFLYLFTETALSLQTIALSFMFVSGIGYVWIIRVFLIIAIISPFLSKISRNISKSFLFFLLLLSIFICSDVLDYIAQQYLNFTVYKLFQISILYALPYGSLFLLGTRWTDMPAKQIALTLVISGSIFIGFAAYHYINAGSFVPTQEFKYPPSIYYLSFAITSISFVELIIRFANPNNLPRSVKSAISFISENSIWIYLWHIPFVELIDESYINLYFIALIGSLAIVFLQSQLIDKLQAKLADDIPVAKFALRLFRG